MRHCGSYCLHHWTWAISHVMYTQAVSMVKSNCKFPTLQKLFRLEWCEESLILNNFPGKSVQYLLFLHRSIFLSLSFVCFVFGFLFHFFFFFFSHVVHPSASDRALKLVLETLDTIINVPQLFFRLIFEFSIFSCVRSIFSSCYSLWCAVFTFN